MRENDPRRGAAMLISMMFLAVVALLIITATVNRNIMASRNLHRGFYKIQADWLAHSAVEQALDVIKGSGDDVTPSKREFSEKIASVFVGEDPFDDTNEGDNDPRIITAEYSYQISNVGENLLKQDEAKGFLISARCNIPYRLTKLTSIQTRICAFSADNGWRVRPLVSK
jgi:hypothetical protein